ncbi:cytochrome C oxidase subunit IV family protein [Akkermansiaceae bacterium]|nr:cytochrome C oxidase subunit IV family protein [Akkermansiaceae bacterium]MDB4519359.1 cytochrome C oxidase subunit IV family protein [Akkermansiaceae bacterium]
MADTPEAIQKAKKLYAFIGLLLFFFTGITVAVATIESLDFGGHGFGAADAIIGLVIASFKACLVMIIFMHLNNEKPMVYFLFALGLVMAFFCVWLIGWSKSDPIQYGNSTKADGFYNPEKPASDVHSKTESKY